MNMENVEAKYLALGPLDGRYHEIAETLAPYFSEFALMRYRVKVEVEWLIFVVNNLKYRDLPLPTHAVGLGPCACDVLRSLYLYFCAADMARIKDIEENHTNHDVKAVEIFIDEKLDDKGYSALKPLVHIGCTSEDINNLAYAMMFRDALTEIWQENAFDLIDKLNTLAINWARTPMLAHTHGQPATPTTLGKEIRVMAERLNRVFDTIDSGALPILGKFNGATGTYAAISLAYPNYNWALLSENFVEGQLGLDFNPCTTQIESHDWLAAILDNIRRFNNILRNIDQDIWTYISMEYLVQIPKEGEVGSSTMPHKVNPIHFENSEANCEMSSGLCQTLADQLMNSRMQRDLTDSSLIRNVGLAIGYSLLAIKNCRKGLERIAPGRQKLAADLDSHWEVLSEAIQTVLRKHGVADAYDQLKNATRGKAITNATDIWAIIADVTVQVADNPDACADLARISEMSPKDYIGCAVDIACYDAS